MSRKAADAGHPPRPHVQADPNPPRRCSPRVPRLPTDLPARLRCSACGTWRDRGELVQKRGRLECRDARECNVESYAPNGMGREEER